MRLLRDISGVRLIKLVARFGYCVTRQTGSHARLTCELPESHHVTVPDHNPLRVGTLAAFVADISVHHRLEREELVRRLFG